MLPNLLQISTLHIQPSLVLCQVFDLGTFYFNLKSYSKFSYFFKSIHFYLLFYFLIVESPSSSSPAPKPPSKLWAILFRYPFFSLRSSQIPTKAETFCLQPPVPLPTDSTSNSTWVQIFFLGHCPSPTDLFCCFRLETRIPLMVQTIFWPAQWSHDFCHPPSGGHTQYCMCHWHQSQTWSPFIPGSSLY